MQTLGKLVKTTYAYKLEVCNFQGFSVTLSFLKFSSSKNYCTMQNFGGRKFWQNRSHQTLEIIFWQMPKIVITPKITMCQHFTSKIESYSTPVVHGSNQTLYCAQINT